MIKINSQLVIITTSAILMQIHSIGFWMDQVGPMGIAWSLTLEMMMIWFWWRGIWPMALIASVLLIAGPMHQVTQPSIKSMSAHWQAEKSNLADRAEIAELRASIATYERNSEKRPGWLPKINRVQKRINAAVDRISERERKNPEFRIFGISIKEAIAAAQALTLIIIMTGQAIAISDQRKIAAKNRKTLENNDIDAAKASEFPPPSMSHQPHHGEKIEATKNASAIDEKPDAGPGLTGLSEKQKNALQLISQIPAAINRVTTTQCITQGEWCRANDINQKHLSLAKNHARNLSQGKELAPGDAIRRILHCLDIKQQISHGESH